MLSSILRSQLEATFPRNATSWAQATDEVRDMCRTARQTLGIGDHLALDFRSLNTPGDWNRRGIDQIIAYYDRMSAEQRAEWTAMWAETLQWLQTNLEGK